MKIYSLLCVYMYYSYYNIIIIIIIIKIMMIIIIPNIPCSIYELVYPSNSNTVLTCFGVNDGKL